MPPNQQSQSHDAVKMLKNMMQTDFINGPARKMKPDNISNKIWSRHHNIVRIRGKIYIDVLSNLCFTAAKMQS